MSACKLWHDGKAAVLESISAMMSKQVNARVEVEQVNVFFSKRRNIDACIKRSRQCRAPPVSRSFPDCAHVSEPTNTFAFRILTMITVPRPRTAERVDPAIFGYTELPCMLGGCNYTGCGQIYGIEGVHEERIWRADHAILLP